MRVGWCATAPGGDDSGGACCLPSSSQNDSDSTVRTVMPASSFWAPRIDDASRRPRCPSEISTPRLLVAGDLRRCALGRDGRLRPPPTPSGPGPVVEQRRERQARRTHALARRATSGSRSCRAGRRHRRLEDGVAGRVGAGGRDRPRRRHLAQPHRVGAVGQRPQRQAGDGLERARSTRVSGSATSAPPPRQDGRAGPSAWPAATTCPGSTGVAVMTPSASASRRGIIERVAGEIERALRCG